MDIWGRDCSGNNACVRGAKESADSGACVWFWANMEYSSSRKKDADKCLQTWYGEYYLPNTIHVRTADSDEKFKEDLVAGIDYTEDYWKNDGYLIVRFKINTVKGAEDHLFYDATETSSGYCDM